ncbi:MAG: hypothetical protein WC222_01640 [Parachlamydiales bacterium]
MFTGSIRYITPPQAQSEGYICRIEVKHSSEVTNSAAHIRLQKIFEQFDLVVTQEDNTEGTWKLLRAGYRTVSYKYVPEVWLRKYTITMSSTHQCQGLLAAINKIFYLKPSPVGNDSQSTAS